MSEKKEQADADADAMNVRRASDVVDISPHFAIEIEHESARVWLTVVDSYDFPNLVLKSVNFCMVRNSCSTLEESMT